MLNLQQLRDASAHIDVEVSMAGEGDTWVTSQIFLINQEMLKSQSMCVSLQC